MSRFLARRLPPRQIDRAPEPSCPSTSARRERRRPEPGVVPASVPKRRSTRQLGPMPPRGQGPPAKRSCRSSPAVTPVGLAGPVWPGRGRPRWPW
jgi:hypothetical protein